jgi:cGMP-dependent protein kinase
MLQTVPDFEGLPASCREEIADSLVEVNFEDGDLIMQEGDIGTAFYILYSGSVQIENAGKKATVLSADKRSMQHPHFGEQALLNDSGRRMYTARSVGSSTVLALEKDTFLRFKELWEGYQGPTWDSNDKKIGLYRRDDLLQLKKLGEGAFGEVTLVLHKPSGARFALKSLQKKQVEELESQRCVLNEKAVLRLTDSGFLVRAAAMFNMDANIEFLMEAVTGGELLDLYQENGLYGNEALVRFHIGCTFRGLQHLHERFIMYRDLKPENLLVDARGYCKICDFGLAKFSMGRAHTFCGTPDYLAPELADQQGYTRAVDWWGLGILVYELMTSDTPFQNEDPMEILKLAKAGIDKAAWPTDAGQWGDFVIQLCQQRPEKRLPLKANGVETHAWFAEAPGWSWELLDKQSVEAPWKPSVSNSNKTDDSTFTVRRLESTPSCREISTSFLDAGDDNPPEEIVENWSSGFEELQGPAPELFLETS